MGAVEPLKKVVTITEIAYEALEAASGDLAKATDIMMRRLKGDKELYTKLLEPLICRACYEALRSVVQSKRESVVYGANMDVEQAERVAALAHANERMLTLFPLPKYGKSLGQATRMEIQGAAEFYFAQGTEMVRRARFLTQVAKAVSGDKIAAKCVTEQQLRKLWEQTENE